MIKPNEENERLAALQRNETPNRLILSYYRFDSSRIKDIIAMAAKFDITLTNSQAVRYAIRNCQINEATAADFIEITQEDSRRSRSGKK